MVGLGSEIWGAPDGFFGTNRPGAQGGLSQRNPQKKAAKPHTRRSQGPGKTNWGSCKTSSYIIHHHPNSSQVDPPFIGGMIRHDQRTMNTKWTKGLGFIVCRCPREYGAWSLSPVMSSYVQFHLGYNSFFPLFITHLFISQLYWTNWGITVQFRLVIYFITHFSQHSGCPAEVVPVFLFHLVKSEPGEPEPGAPGEAQHPQKSTTRPGYD